MDTDVTDAQEFLERVSRLSPKRLALLALDLQSKVDADGASRAEPIAIVGMGCRFPGGANTPSSYWDLLRDGVDAIQEIPADRWDVAALFDPDPDAIGKIATRWGGFVEGIDQFDPNAFGISPREAVSMDPQQRLLLEVGWEALENAGYAADTLADSPTGVFVGICNGDYYQMLMDADPTLVDAYAATGSAHSVASGRLSYLLGLRGPSLSIDTACSSSLVSVHLAIQSLRSGECRLALAGGVNAILSPRTTIALSRSKMMAADGRCKAFDASADGFVRSEGCGLVVLKRLSNAQADGDRILALVRGSAVNQDGRSNGLTAPNGPSQVAVIRLALANAGVEAAEVGYVETHGTGTSLGDPIEVQALAAALGARRGDAERLLLGSVKTNMGHLESAAGIAGLIKTVLMLQHQQVPPHLHLRTPNPHIAWDELPVTVPTHLTDWRPLAGRRIAGVSSFGFSGTNAHVILEQGPPAMPAVRPAGPGRPQQLLALSARTEPALRELAGRYAEVLARTSDRVSLADVAHTANTGRARLGYRLAVVGAEKSDVAPQLASLAAGKDAADLLGVTYRQSHGRPKVAFLFTGHGTLSAGAGRQLWETQPIFRAALESCAGFADVQLEKPLLAALYPYLYPGVPGAESLLDDMTYAQPALFALQYALASMWQAWGVVPAQVAGHSAGEYAAASVAGILSMQDGLNLTMARGRLMASLPPTGQMATVLADEATVRARLDDRVVVAAINGPASIVISGDASAVQAALGRFNADGIETRALNIPLAAHSPQVDGILDAFERVASGATYSAAAISVVSTLTGELATGSDCASAAYWRRHLRQPVQFAGAMQTLDRQGCDVFVEIGPRATLLGMARANLADSGAAASWLPSLRPDRGDWEQVLESLAGLFVAGVDVDFGAFDRDGGQWRRLELPTYPFQRQRYWITASRPSAPGSQGSAMRPTEDASPLTGDASPLTGDASRLKAEASLLTGGEHSLLGRRVESPALDDGQVVFATELGAEWPAFLGHHRVHGVCIAPAPVYVAMALEAASRGLGWALPTLENVSIQTALVLPEIGTRAVQLVLDSQTERGPAFRIFGREDTNANEPSTWTLHASGQLVQSSTRPAVPSDLQPGAGSGGAAFDAAAVRGRCAEVIDGPAYYARLQELGLEFGPQFRGIARVWRTDGEALAEVVLPAGLEENAGAYGIHPAFLDACFHVLGAAAPAATAAPAAYLLVGLDAFTLYRAAGARLLSHAVLRSASGADTLEGDVHVYDADDGALVAEVRGLHLRRAAAEALNRPPLDWVYETVWHAKPLPALAEPADVAAPWLVLAPEQFELGIELAKLITARGGTCHLVANPVDIAPGARTAARVVDLRSLEPPVTPEGVAGAALETMQAIVRSGDERLWLVTRDAQAVPASGGVREPDAATLWGLGRVFALEAPTHWGGLIDLSSDHAPAAAAALIYDTVMRHDGEDQVAWRADGRRYVPRLERAVLPRPTADQALVLRPDASYLISGGLGGLGLKLARWLAENGARHLVLLGRAGLPDRTAWDALSPDSRAATQVAAVQAIEALGATVWPIAVDVANPHQMRERVMARLTVDTSSASTARLKADPSSSETDRLTGDIPPLRGIFHAAADLSSWAIADMPAEALHAMLRPKVGGAYVLDELTRDLPLDFFVLFSSTTALWGARNLAHYAAANSFLDAFAHYRRASGLTAVSINWGTWDEMRVTTAQERDAYQQFGLSPMASPLALATLKDILGTPELTQIAVAAVDWGSLKPLYEARGERPFLADVGGPPTPAPQANGHHAPQRSSLLVQLDALHEPAERHKLVFDHVRAEVARTLRVPRPQAIDPQTGLFDLGMDSLMSVELRSKLEMSVGRSLPSTLTFNYSTVAALTTYLLEQVLTPPISKPSPELPAPTASVSPAVDNLDDLSEDELAATLAATLAGLR